MPNAMLDLPIHIGFCAPSRVIADTDKVEAIRTFLSQRAVTASFDETVFHNEKMFGGNDSERLNGLMRMVSDPSVDVVMPIRGGYGLTRILHVIDFDAIARHEPILCGLSDFTLFNLAYFAHTGKVSYQGPTGSSFQSTCPDSAWTSFVNAISDECWEVNFASPDTKDSMFEGTIWGGNLTMMTSILGTKHFPNVEGGILFLEDVHERAYRIERMLLQLEMAGVLQRQKVILLGDFKGADPIEAKPNDFLLSDVLDYLRVRLPSVPIVTGLPFGHIDARVTIPVGAHASMAVSEGIVTVRSTDHPTIYQRKG